MRGHVPEPSSEATPPLWAAARLARTADPATSHEAAEAILPDLTALLADTLAAVRRWPDRNALELERLAGVRERTFGRRLSELERRGLIRRLPARRCPFTGRSADTWIATE